VGVACEHEVDKRAARVGDDVVGVVGLVRHEKNGAVGFGGKREIEIRVAGAGIIDAAEPKAGTGAFDGDVLVDQNRSAVGVHGPGDCGGVVGNVVIAEDPVAEGSGEGGEDLGATMEGMVAGDEGEGAVGDEVAGEENEVRGQTVDFADDVLEKVGFGVLVEMDVADLGDAIAVERCREVGDGDGAVDDVDLVPCDLTGVEGDPGRSGTRADEEVAAGKA